jgi:hypothetical protein
MAFLKRKSVDSLVPEEDSPVLKQTKRDKYYSSFPETLILFITTHGETCVLEKVPHEPEVFNIPDSINKLFKLNLAPSGVSAVMTAIELDDVNAAMKGHIFETKLNSIEQKTCLEMYRTLINEQLELQDVSKTNDPLELLNFMRNLQDTITYLYQIRMPLSEHFAEERCTINKSVNLHIWVEKSLNINRVNEFEHVSKQMVNKYYITGNPSSEHSASPLNFGILAVNFIGEKYRDILPDILLSMKKPQRSTKVTLSLKTSDILEFLSNIKDPDGKAIIQNVLIIDTSCANFEYRNPQYKERLSTESSQYGYGGKKSKRRTKKYKRTLRKKYISKKNNTRKIKKNYL